MVIVIGSPTETSFGFATTRISKSPTAPFHCAGRAPSGSGKMLASIDLGVTLSVREPASESRF